MSRRGTRVALLNPVFWPEVRRGSERFARELADGLLALGHRPRLVTSHPARTARGIEEGLEVVRLRRPPGEGRLRRRLLEEHLLHVPATALELRRGDDELAHALHPTDAVAAGWWKARTGRPVVLSYMGIPHRQGLANRRLRIETTLRALAAADAVVALSATAARGFARWLGVDARVIPPGVDLEAFAPAAGARAADPTILCAATIAEPRKRVRLLLDALPHVRAEHPTVRLVLSRPAPGGEAAAARALGLPSLAALPAGVELADLDDRAALAAANRAAWVAALPSFGEAFGLVLLEAMACGTPVVAADREALPEVVDSPAVGRLFGGDDPAAVAGALLEGLQLARHPATPVACRARAARFSTAATARAYADLYAELLAA